MIERLHADMARRTVAIADAIAKRIAAAEPTSSQSTQGTAGTAAR